MADMMDITNEINETLGQSYGVPDEIDEEELMGELDLLEEELAKEPAQGEMPSYLQEPDLPEIPNSESAHAMDSYGLPMKA